MSSGHGTTRQMRTENGTGLADGGPRSTRGVHIGNPHGRIAIWCDESEALEIADHYGYPDRFGLEIGEAVERAYPKEDGDA